MQYLKLLPIAIDILLWGRTPHKVHFQNFQTIKKVTLSSDFLLSFGFLLDKERK